jgi:SAM-dependent methyltransferase
MQMAGYQVEGTEYSADGAARVPAEWKIPVHVGDLTTLSLEPGTYDGVCLWHVFEHVRKPAETVERARTLLRTGGIFLLAMPNQESLQAERFGKNWFHLDPPRHLFGFGPKSLTALLEKEGFTVEETGTLSWEQNPYGWAQSLLNRWGFPRERAYETLKRTGTHGLSARLLDVVLLAMLVPYAIILSAVEAARGRGGTLILVARKKSA